MPRAEHGWSKGCVITERPCGSFGLNPGSTSHQCLWASYITSLYLLHGVLEKLNELWHKKCLEHCLILLVRSTQEIWTPIFITMWVSSSWWHKQVGLGVSYIKRKNIYSKATFNSRCSREEREHQGRGNRLNDRTRHLTDLEGGQVSAARHGLWGGWGEDI